MATGYSAAGYQTAWGSLSVNGTIVDGNTATGPSFIGPASGSVSLTAGRDEGSSAGITAYTAVIGYVDNPTAVLEWSADSVTWHNVFAIGTLLLPTHGGTFSLETITVDALDLPFTARYTRLSLTDDCTTSFFIPNASIREMTATVGTPTITIDEIAPGVDWWQTPEVSILSIDEGAPGSDATAVVYREIVIDEGAPGRDYDIGFVPTIVWEERAPGGDGSSTTQIACTVRERSKYCPNGDGTYNRGYAVTLLSQNNHLDFDPSLYITFTSPVTVNLGNWSLEPVGTFNVEALAEATFGWWQPANNYYRYRYANSSRAIGEYPPDDTLNNFIYGFLGDDVAIGLRYTRTTATISVTAQLRPDGHGGLFFFILAPEHTTTFTETIEQYWDAHVGDPQHILIYSQGVLGFQGTDSQECFEVNPYYDNTTQLFLDAYRKSGGGNVKTNYIYQLSVSITTYTDVEWLFGYLTYSKAMYSCCAGDCPPCTGAPPTIASGQAGVVCLSSSFIACSDLPVGSTITGPEPFASEMSIIDQRGCQCVVQTHCLTQAQIDAKEFAGPYTVRIPLKSKCLQAGGVYRCEMLVGTFYLSAFEICDTGGVPSNPFNLQDEHGRYHITGGGGSYKRSNFGTNKSVGWAAESTLSAPAGRSFHDLRVIVDHRQTVWACYAQQVTADSSWDGIYYRTSNDDGKTWEDAVLAITGGKHPTIAIGTDGSFDVIVVAAYVGPVGGPGVITAKSRAAGDTALSDAFNFKDTAGADLVAEDDTFHVQQARDDQSRWMLHIVINGEGGSSQWTSFDECRTFERVT